MKRQNGGAVVLTALELYHCAGVTGISLAAFCALTPQNPLHVVVTSCLDYSEGQEVKSCLEAYGKPGLQLSLMD
eukprot:gene27912-12026_t